VVSVSVFVSVDDRHRPGACVCVRHQQTRTQTEPTDTDTDTDGTQTQTELELMYLSSVAKDGKKVRPHILAKNRKWVVTNDPLPAEPPSQKVRRKMDVLPKMALVSVALPPSNHHAPLTMTADAELPVLLPSVPASSREIIVLDTNSNTSTADRNSCGTEERKCKHQAKKIVVY
jgi:hypothetical protein